MKSLRKHKRTYASQDQRQWLFVREKIFLRDRWSHWDFTIVYAIRGFDIGGGLDRERPLIISEWCEIASSPFRLVGLWKFEDNL